MQILRAAEGVWCIPRRGAGLPILVARSRDMEARMTGFPYSLYTPSESGGYLRLCLVQTEAAGKLVVGEWEAAAAR